MWAGGENDAATVENEAIVDEDIVDDEINFDRALPGLHKYLGGDFVEVTGRTFLESGTKACMPAFYRSGVILVPGQSLPVKPYSSYESSLLLKIHRDKRPMTFLPGCFDHVSSLDEMVDFVGTTADLVAISIPSDSDESTIHAIFVGRQRISISKVTRDDSFSLVCHGSILPELSTNPEMASHPLGHGLVPRSWSRFGSDPRTTRPKTQSHDPLASEPDGVGVSSGPSGNKLSRRWSSRARQDSSSSGTTQTNHCYVPPGNPLSIFDSRVSTWRRYGPISSGSLSSSSGNSPVDHFDGDPPSSDPIVTDPQQASRSGPPPAKSCKPLEGFDPATSTSAESGVEANSVNQDAVTEDVELIMDRAVDRVGRPFRYRIRQPCHPRLLARRDMLAAVATSFAPLPVWIYRQYDLNYLVTAIQTELLSWNDTWQVDRFRPDLAVPFSYWLVQNLPMSGLLKAHILGINHVVPRLRALLDVVRRSAACVCVYCDWNITSNRFIICLAQEGSFQTYVNPSGVLHDIVTVSQVLPNSVTLVGPASEEYSWFPGYSWTIANCSNCSHHLGWLFNAVKENLRPVRFWGIRRQAVVPGLINSPDWRPCI